MSHAKSIQRYRPSRLPWLLAGMLLLSCSTLRLASDYDRAEDFSKFRSFSWLPRTHYGSHNPLVVQRTHDAIDAALLAKGFTHAPESSAANFIVDFTIGSKERMDVASYPAPYNGPYWGYEGAWGIRYWGNDIDVRQFREGTLSVDVFDAHTHRPVWHGQARKELTHEDLENSEPAIKGAVNQLLAEFPPRPYPSPQR